MRCLTIASVAWLLAVVAATSASAQTLTITGFAITEPKQSTDRKPNRRQIPAVTDPTPINVRVEGVRVTSTSSATGQRTQSARKSARRSISRRHLVIRRARTARKRAAKAWAKNLLQN